MKLQSKVLVIIIPVMAFFMSISGVFIFKYINTDFYNQIDHRNQSEIKQYITYIDSYKEQRVKDLEFLSSINKINSFFTNSGYARYANIQTELISLFESIYIKESNVKEYILMDIKGNIIFDYSQDIFYNSLEDLTIFQSYLKSYKLKQESIAIFSDKLSTGNRIIYIKKIDNIGYLLMTEDVSFLKILKAENNHSDYAMFVLNKGFLLESYNNKDLDFDFNFNSIFKTREYSEDFIKKDLTIENNNYISYLVNTEYDIQFLALYPKYIIENKQFYYFLIISILVFIFTILISFLIFISINRKIIKPINMIKSVALSVKEGNYENTDPYDSKDELGELSKTISDMTDNLISEKEKVHKMAFFDHLTGLSNKRHFQLTLPQHFENAAFTQEEVAIMLIDLDDFKEINEAYGHSIGDEFLKEISKKIILLLKESLKMYEDTTESEISRFGGDDFVILLKGKNLMTLTKIIAEQIINNISDKIVVDEKAIYPSASIGISHYPEHAKNETQLFQFADMAMYDAKNKGKNQYSIINPQILDNNNEQEILSKEIKEALANDDFELHFQPKFNIATGEYDSFEALIRWIHADKGFISPSIFIPFAEKSNLIVQIGDWVTKTVCNHVKTLEEMGWKNFKVSFNVSYKQMQEETFIDKLQSAIHKAKINPKHLEMEITEYAIVKDLDQALLDLQSVRRLGVSVSLDDFGTGYSSLIYLQSLPLDVLKIDRAFVCKSVDSKQSQAIIKTIITLAKGLGLRTVAEGVETREEYDLLKSYGCDYIQGFFLHRPMQFGKILDMDRKKEDRV
jgi:diguanylate cyclase (GGDEF)-like protein